MLYPKFSEIADPFVAIFICSAIQLEKYRFNYGRKWNLERMKASTIKLPAKEGKPHRELIRNYIASLPFSSALPDEGITAAHAS